MTLVIASRASDEEAVAIAQGYITSFPATTIFQSANGYYAITLGWAMSGDASRVLQTLLRSRQIPDDAFLSGGNKFLSAIWPQRAKPTARFFKQTQFQANAGTKAPSGNQDEGAEEKKGTEQETRQVDKNGGAVPSTTYSSPPSSLDEYCERVNAEPNPTARSCRVDYASEVVILRDAATPNDPIFVCQALARMIQPVAPQPNWAVHYYGGTKEAICTSSEVLASEDLKRTANVKQALAEIEQAIVELNPSLNEADHTDVTVAIVNVAALNRCGADAGVSSKIVSDAVASAMRLSGLSEPQVTHVSELAADKMQFDTKPPLVNDCLTAISVVEGQTKTSVNEPSPKQQDEAEERSLPGENGWNPPHTQENQERYTPVDPPPFTWERFRRENPALHDYVRRRMAEEQKKLELSQPPVVGEPPQVEESQEEQTAPSTVTPPDQLTGNTLVMNRVANLFIIFNALDMEGPIDLTLIDQNTNRISIILRTSGKWGTTSGTFKTINFEVRRVKDRPCMFTLYDPTEQPTMHFDFTYLTIYYRYGPGWISFHGDGVHTIYCFTVRSPMTGKLVGSPVCMKSIYREGMNGSRQQAAIDLVSEVQAAACPAVRPQIYYEGK